MKNYFVAGLIFYVICLCDAGRTIPLHKIADKINGKKNHPWKASSYGLLDIDREIFKSTRLVAEAKQVPPQLSDLNYYYDFSENILKTLMVEKKSSLKTAQNSTELPTNFTWAHADRDKTHGCQIEINEQSNCASSWPVAIVSAFGYRLCLTTKGEMKTPLSSNLVIACTNWGHRCGGGYPYQIHNYLLYNGTVTGGQYDSDEGCQPYSIRPCGFPYEFDCSFKTALPPKCQPEKCTNKNNPKQNANTKYKIQSFHNLDGIDKVKREIYNNGPVTASFLVYDDFLTYKKGVYVHTFGRWAVGIQAVQIIGWGVENGMKYWHAVNSWGPKWGDNGFFKILLGSDHCDIEDDLKSVTPKPPLKLT